jgi:hypothetical protein
MSKFLRETDRVPCEDHHANAPLTQEHPLGHVVQSPFAVGPGFHPDRIEFDTARHYDPTEHHDNTPRDDASPVDHHEHAGARAESDHVDDEYDTRDSTALDRGVDERAARQHLLERDRFERQARRLRARRERNERRAHGSTSSILRSRRRPPRGSRHLVNHHELAGANHGAVRQSRGEGADPDSDRLEGKLSTHHHRRHSRDLTNMATHPRRLKRPLAARVHGTALVAYFALLPYVVFTKWRLATNESHGTLVRSLLVLLATFWLGFLIQVGLNVWRLKQGRRVNGGASAWLAGLVVALLTLLIPTSGLTLKPPAAMSVPFAGAATMAPAPRHGAPSAALGLAGVPMALMAKRRSDLLRQLPDHLEDLDVEESIELLRARNPELIGQLAQLIGDSLEGVLDVSDTTLAMTTNAPITPVVACVLETTSIGSLVGFAREGGRLPILPSWSGDDVMTNVVALHDGKLLFAKSEPELLRFLATRSLHQNLVVYLGAALDLDDELAACAITLSPYADPRQSLNRNAQLTPGDAPLSSDLRVELLRADPQVLGLLEPFTPTLRRRCVEMVAYLALHRHEPVTGERLRSRVLTHADVDASNRTLANTASAVRRSLGLDARGPRLHPVTSSGLYVTHGLSSDVELFSTLIGRARQLPVNDASPLTHQALLLIKGEPLASALRGFEWFLAEGHGARLARDGEWAALALHHSSLERRNYEMAFWALQQGLLIDPYSDALSDALSRVPRLREFGGDGARGTKNDAVRSRDAVAMSWSFARFTQQVSK